MRWPLAGLGEVEPLVARQRAGVGEHDVTVGCARSRPCHRRARPTCSPACTASKLHQGRTKRSASCRRSTTSVRRRRSNVGGRRQRARRRPGRATRSPGGSRDRPTVGRRRVVVLAAFERDAVAALRAHVLGGADAVTRVGVVGQARRTAPRRTLRVGCHPAFDDARRAQMLGQATLDGGVREGLERGRRCRPDRASRTAGPGRRNECRSSSTSCAASHGHSTLAMRSSNSRGVARVGRRRRLRLRSPRRCALRVGQRVSHRHQRQQATLDAQRTGVEIGQHTFDGARAAGLVAMHGAEHDQSRRRRRSSPANWCARSVC